MTAAARISALARPNVRLAVGGLAANVMVTSASATPAESVEHVAGVRDQRDAAGQPRADDLHDHDARGARENTDQPPAVLSR